MPDSTSDELDSQSDQSWQALSTLSAINLRAILMQEQTNMSLLRNQLAVSQQKIDMIKTMLSPFTRLPQELVSEIFQFYCASQGTIYDAFQKRKTRTRPSKIDPDRIVDGINTIPPQLILTQVCNFWRSVAHETHPLWTDLTMYIQSGKFAYHGDLIEDWISHSGEVLPLNIRIIVPKGKGQATRSVLESIKPFSERWCRLELSAPLQTLLPLLSVYEALEAPLLEHVYIDVCHATESSMQAYDGKLLQLDRVDERFFRTFLDAPKLHSYRCGISFETSPESLGFEMSLNFLHIMPYCDEITELALEGLAYEAYEIRGLHFVSLFARNLVSCSIKVSSGATFVDTVPFPITFPKLQTLSVTVDDPVDGVHFFRELTTPSLKILKLRLDKEVNFHTDTFGELLGMQRRSSFVLEELHLHDHTATFVNLSAFLQSLTSLRSLTVYETNQFRMQDLIPWLANGMPPRHLVPCGDCLPNLRELRLLGGPVLKNGNDQPLMGIADLIYERSRRASGETKPGQNLQILEIQMTEVAFGSLVEEEDTYDPDALAWFIGQGLEMRLSLWMPNGSLRYLDNQSFLDFYLQPDRIFERYL